MAAQGWNHNNYHGSFFTGCPCGSNQAKGVEQFVGCSDIRVLPGAPTPAPPPPTPAPPTNWKLVFRQTMPYLYSAGEWSKNPEDPENDNFAILDRLEDFRFDGALEFQLVWPDMEPQRWRQSSNPVTETTGGVTGYEPISTPYTEGTWKGLGHGG